MPMKGVMSLAKSFSESVRESLVQPSALPSGAVWKAPEGRPRRTRVRGAIATGVAASLELAFFLGVGGMMAAGALLLR